MKRKTTKQKVLNILKKESEVTIVEIMAYFSISEIAVRKHIHELEQQGFLKKNTIKQKVGRPYHTYELTKKGHDTFPNQYESLPLELLQDLEELQGTQAVNDLLSKRMQREKSYFDNEIHTTAFDEKVEEVARIQDEKGYMVEVEKTEDGHYEMKHFNCPISNIASTYNQVCSNEKMVFEEVFSSSEVISHTCITKGHNYCRWTIKKPKEDD
ncbi:DeoR family transcriptional regulator [Virgibacillus sp. C22-A2]|uniref:DeoR family transcriptional regulator n=1 Tax=Virgibacillus tibetensis TaxID=3042313 RepID=A0ABU6KJ96_9BACI|nr:DeoR family transcriptional regulator [Virgibacillus sp. C22-A2]